MSLSHWSLLCFFIEKLYTPPSALSSPLPCIIFIQYLSLSNILLDLLTYYLLAVPSTKCKIQEVKFLCILSILYPQHLNQRRCLINSCWMNEWMNVWMCVFCLVIGWYYWSGRTLATTLCASFWIQLPYLIVWLDPLFWIEIFFFPRSFFNGFDLAVYRSGALPEVISSDSGITQPGPPLQQGLWVSIFSKKPILVQSKCSVYYLNLLSFRKMTLLYLSVLPQQVLQKLQDTMYGKYTHTNGVFNINLL